MDFEKIGWVNLSEIGQYLARYGVVSEFVIASAVSILKKAFITKA